MRVTYDPAKRAGTTVEIEDLRKDYGETRINCYGYLAKRLVVIGYTPAARTDTYSA